MKALVLAASSLLLATSAMAAETEPAQDPNERVCFVEPKVGSHIKKRTCMTRKQYEARRKADQDAMSRLQSGRTAGGKGESSQGGLN